MPPRLSSSSCRFSSLSFELAVHGDGFSTTPRYVVNREGALWRPTGRRGIRVEREARRHILPLGQFGENAIHLFSGERSQGLGPDVTPGTDGQPKRGH